MKTTKNDILKRKKQKRQDLEPYKELERTITKGEREHVSVLYHRKFDWKEGTIAPEIEERTKEEGLKVNIRETFSLNKMAMVILLWFVSLTDKKYYWYTSWSVLRMKVKDKAQWTIIKRCT